MKIRYPVPDDPFAVIELDGPRESSLIIYALDCVATGREVRSADIRRSARNAYEALNPTAESTDDDWRACQCTGGSWCRCPVTSPCPQRGSSTVTGTEASIARVVRAHLTPDVP